MLVDQLADLKVGCSAGLKVVSLVGLSVDDWVGKTEILKAVLLVEPVVEKTVA